ncbi:MAG TPA: copper amine oxidase N-terminal domain-containing protein, partial [Thermoanaerobaculia bacterium]|nr:copper amine oxidase N-terminal domain-containing protein [Thermoanaerobaculia bacterium]
MKRLALLGAVALLALASIVLAQSPAQATLRLPSGDKPIGIVQQSGQTFVSANDVVGALGGTIAPDSSGYKITINNATAAFGPDSRFGVVRDELIEMPVPPLSIDGKPYVPWQFFQGLLAKATSQDVLWDAATHVLLVRAQQQNAVGVQASVANVQGISKIVLTLTGPAEYGIVKEPGAYVVKFKTPLRAPFAEQTYEDPYASKIAFAGSDVRIQLTGPDIAGDAYQLDNPPRIVIDLHKAAAPSPGTPGPIIGIRPTDQPG